MSQHASEITLYSAIAQKGSKGNKNGKWISKVSPIVEDNGVSIAVLYSKALEEPMLI